jgi:hypothetical protein
MFHETGNLENVANSRLEAAIDMQKVISKMLNKIKK